jgi:hypothetical protein
VSQRSTSTKILPLQKTDENPSGKAGLSIGNRDLEANAVSLRVHGQGNLGAKPSSEIIAEILQSIKERRA